MGSCWVYLWVDWLLRTKRRLKALRGSHIWGQGDTFFGWNWGICRWECRWCYCWNLLPLNIHFAPKLYGKCWTALLFHRIGRGNSLICWAFSKEMQGFGSKGSLEDIFWIKSSDIRLQMNSNCNLRPYNSVEWGFWCCCGRQGRYFAGRTALCSGLVCQADSS